MHRVWSVNGPYHFVCKLWFGGEGMFDSALLKNEIMVLYGSEELNREIPLTRFYSG
jgi:hypothetical protein